jgi:hypothetical protein
MLLGGGGPVGPDDRTRERVRRAAAYLGQEDAQVAALNEMGLTSAEIAELVSLIADDERLPAPLRADVARLYAARRDAEERAGIAIPLVVVEPDRSRRWKLLLAGIVAIGAALGAAIARGAGLL